MILKDDLVRMLRARPQVPTAQLLAAFGVSRATFMRAVHAAGSDVLTIGRGRRSSYAARRHLRGNSDSLPVLQIDDQGGSEQVGHLGLAYPDGSVFE